MQYDEFRLSLMPDLQNPGSWAVQVLSCPEPYLVGPKGTVKTVVTREQVKRLRSRENWPNIDDLRAIGTNVWASVMSPAAEAAFLTCVNKSKQQGKGLRLIVSMLGETSPLAGNGSIGLAELPLEALYNQATQFVATDHLTPVSRGVTAQADRPPLKVVPPLRMLLVVATPRDKPPAAGDEEQAVREALQPLVDSRAIEVVTCQPPTTDRFRDLLQQGFHIVHFVGHGGYEVVGNDPTPRPHICFEDGKPARESDPVDGDQLYVILRNTSVQLVVLTSCSSAAATPNQVPAGPYAPLAMEGLAQGLVEGVSGPAAVVAMQFDFETDAARTFSQSIYRSFLDTDWALDEAIARARTAMILKFKAGHRCWINPTIYWRCVGGKLFQIETTTPGQSLSDDDRRNLTAVEFGIDLLYEQFRYLAAQPQRTRDAAADLRAQWQLRLQELLQERSLILGETVRLYGGKPDANGAIQCKLSLRIRTPATIGDVKVTATHDPSVFDALGISPGQHAPPNSLFSMAGAAGAQTALVQDVSQGAALAPGEYELALLSYRLKAAPADPLLYVRLGVAEVERGGVKSQFRSMDAVVFPG